MGTLRPSSLPERPRGRHDAPRLVLTLHPARLPFLEGREGFLFSLECQVERVGRERTTDSGFSCGLRVTQQYGRSNSLAAYKTDNMELMAASIEIVNDVIKETEMHVKVSRHSSVHLLNPTSFRAPIRR